VAFGLVTALALVVLPVEAQTPLDDGKLTLYGDLRVRFESDWDSRREDGTLRDDRDRMRIRARVGLNWNPIDIVTVGVRLRSGERRSQQSPNLTFWDLDGNGNDPAELSVDRLFIDFRGAGFETWFGRHTSPFWRQNELFWDDDASLTGGTFRHRWDTDDAEYQLVGGYYLLPDGMEQFAGRLLAGQFVYDHQGQRAGSTLTTGLFVVRGVENTEHLRNGNGQRDYKLWSSSAQMRLSHAKFPVTLGADLTLNFESYSPDDPDPFTASNHDQTTGFAVSIDVGRARQRWDWVAGYSFGHIETLAVNASFAENDWMRWGPIHQTDASDFYGHAFRLVLGLDPNVNVITQLYLVNAITSVQDGKRFRFDLNYRF